MKHIFFPGNSISNKDWINNLSRDFSYKDKLILNYDHWRTGNKQIDFGNEVTKIKKLGINNDCIAICKSAGCYLSYLSSKNGCLNIKKFIFIGYPYLWLKKLNIDPLEALEYLGDKLLVIQKEDDPVIGWEALLKIMEKQNFQTNIVKYKKLGEDDNTHSYDDTRYLVELVEEYLNRE